MPGEDVLPSSVKKNSLKRIVLPTLPCKIVSPSLGFKNLIFSFTSYGFFSDSVFVAGWFGVPVFLVSPYALLLELPLDFSTSFSLETSEVL